MNWFIAVWNNYWSLWDHAAHVKHEFFAELATQINCWIFWVCLEGNGSGNWWSNFTRVWWFRGNANLWMKIGFLMQWSIRDSLSYWIWECKTCFKVFLFSTDTSSLWRFYLSLLLQFEITEFLSHSWDIMFTILGRADDRMCGQVEQSTETTKGIKNSNGCGHDCHQLGGVAVINHQWFPFPYAECFWHIRWLVLLELTRHLVFIVMQHGVRRGAGMWSKAFPAAPSAQRSSTYTHSFIQVGCWFCH